MTDRLSVVAMAEHQSFYGAFIISLHHPNSNHPYSTPRLVILIIYTAGLHASPMRDEDFGSERAPSSRPKQDLRGSSRPYSVISLTGRDEVARRIYKWSGVSRVPSRFCFWHQITHATS